MGVGVEHVGVQRPISVGVGRRSVGERLRFARQQDLTEAVARRLEGAVVQVLAGALEGVPGRMGEGFLDELPPRSKARIATFVSVCLLPLTR